MTPLSGRAGRPAGSAPRPLGLLLIQDWLWRNSARSSPAQKLYVATRRASDDQSAWPSATGSTRAQARALDRRFRLQAPISSPRPRTSRSTPPAAGRVGSWKHYSAGSPVFMLDLQAVRVAASSCGWRSSAPHRLSGDLLTGQRAPRPPK